MTNVFQAYVLNHHGHFEKGTSSLLTTFCTHCDGKEKVRNLDIVFPKHDDDDDDDDIHIYVCI